MVTVQQVSQVNAAAINTSPSVDPNAELAAGFYTVQWEGRLQVDATPAQVEAWILQWAEAAEEDPEFIGKIGAIQYNVISPWVADGPTPHPYLVIWIPIEIAEGEVFNGFPGPSNLVMPLVPLVFWMLIALGTATTVVGAVMLLTPGQIRRSTATLGLVLHPDSEVLQDIATEELPEDNVGQFLSTVNVTVLALVAIVLVLNLPKTKG